MIQRTAYDDCVGLRLQSPAECGSRTFLLPFDRPRRIDQGRLAVVSHRAWVHAFEQLLLEAWPFGSLRHVPDTIDLLPYQFEPALAVLRHGHTRLLIADDVGMGKTIEAGLLLRELAERHDGFRGLILVPAGLRQQWADELTSRLAIRAISADAAWLQSIVRELPADVNPWSPPGAYLASFDFVKRPECLRALEELRWDLLVVDEAHAATLSTDRRAAIDALARRSRTILLLTATPPLEPAEFSALCRVGELRGDPPIVMFHRRRARGARETRRSVVLTVRLTEEERRLHRMLERYTTLVWREARRLESRNARLATIVLRKRALSSSVSLAVSLQRRRRLLVDGGAPLEQQLLLPLEDGEEDPRDDVVRDDVLGTSVFSDIGVEDRWIGRVLEAADAAARNESKIRALIRLIRRIRQPAIVFTEYRDTLEHLRGLLTAANLRACVLHGGLSANERRQVLTDFAAGHKILLTTDAAAEGLNLQRTCRVIVHFELPWNPARLLQRAGRVDRIGQRRRVHEIALVAADTAESLVITPLARRAAGWWNQDHAGRMCELLTETRVAEAVFDGVRPEPGREPDRPASCESVDLTTEAGDESRRLERQRGVIHTLALRRPRDSRACIPVTLVRTCRAPGIVLILALNTSTGDDVVIESSLVAIRIETAERKWPRRSLHIKEDLSRLLPHLRAAIALPLQELESHQLRAVDPFLRASRERTRRRDEAIRRDESSAARHLVQAGLFAWQAPSARLNSRSLGASHQSFSARPRDDDDLITPDEIVVTRASVDLRAVLIVERR